MGGAADIPQRASSPLKRRASDLEGDIPHSQKNDVDMIGVPSSDILEPPGALDSQRPQATDKKGNEPDIDSCKTSTGEPQSPVSQNAVEIGMST